MKKEKVKLQHGRFLQSAEDYAAVVRSQKAEAYDIAGKLERGEKVDVQFAAAAIRSWADGLSEKPPAKRGAPPKVDAAEVALLFEILKRRRGYTDQAAFEELANRLSVDEDTIRYAVKACGSAAKRSFETLLGPFGATWEGDKSQG